MNLNPPSESQLLVFWVALLVILVTARAMGSLARRYGQPAIIGELAAGLILGPSLLSRVAPGAADWLFPDDDAQTAMLFTVGWIGVLLLLVVTGFETDLKLIRRLGRAATTVSTGSLVVPAIAGVAVGWLIPTTFVGDGTQRYVFALFFAAALSISSLPVIAKILSEMGLMRRNFGQLTLAAGMANDVVGWIGLGFIAGLAQSDSFELSKLGFTVFGLAVFFALAFSLGQRAVDHGLRQVRANGSDPIAGTSVVVLTALVFGVVTQWLHVEAVLGAFIAGVVLARSRYADHELIRPLETLTAAVFAPIFFATAGLRVDLGLLWDVETFIWTGVVIAAASVSKFAGALLGGMLSRLPNREGAALGVGLNARGALEIVIATVGLSLGVLNDRSYTVIVIMAMVTSMAAPPLLRRALRNWDGTPEERKRIDLEDQLATNQLVTGGRVLIPTRGGVTSLLATQVAALSWPDGSEVMLLTAGPGPVPDLRPHENVLANHAVRLVHERGEANIVDTLIEEAQYGYDAIMLGIHDTDGGDLGSFAEAVLRRSPVPVVLVRAPDRPGARLPWAFARAVVPTNGGASSLPAQELANYLSARLGTVLHQLHVSAAPARALETFFGDTSHAAPSEQRVVDAAARRAITAGANASPIVAHGENTATEIGRVADDVQADLLVLSGTSRVHDGQVFLGHTIPSILSEIDDATVVLALVPQRVPSPAPTT